MKWTVLSDNRSCNPALETEHGLSIILQTERHRILLDGQETGEEIEALAQRLKTKCPNTKFYTSHCTGDHVYEVMKGVMGKQLQAFCAGTVVIQ